jgi:hypothetical protein
MLRGSPPAHFLPRIKDPVAAQVRYAFGGSGGSKRRAESGGGCVSAHPSGTLEVTAEGTRFIEFGERAKIGVALALRIVLGGPVAALTGARRIEMVHR